MAQASDTKPPYDVAAEKSVLGAILLSENGEAWDVVSPILSGSEFFDKKHQSIYRAIERAAQEHGVADATTVAGFLNGSIPKGYLLQLIQQTPAVSGAKAYATIVRDCAHRRHLIRRAQELGAMASEGATPRPMLERLLDEVRTYETGDGAPDGLVDAFEFAGETAQPRDWLIEPLICREGRFMMFGVEGEGKSLLSMQVAVQAANALPVLGRYNVPRPLKVLYVDLEMPHDEIKDRLHQFRITATQETRKVGLESRSFSLLSREDGINLGTTSGQGEFERAVSKARPDLVVIDPVYKACFDRMKDDEKLIPILGFLDRIRRYYSCGLWLCHHPKKSQDPGFKRGDFSTDSFGSVSLNWWLDTLVVLKEGEDTLFCHKGRSKYFKKGTEIRFRRGGTWHFTATDGATMSSLHHEILKLLRRGPAKTAQIRETLAKRKDTILAALRDLDEEFGMVESFQVATEGQHWRLKDSA